MYSTIWVALALFAVGEIGKARGAAWAWPAWLAGVLLTGLHIGMAMASVHGWNHAAAVAATARVTRETFGLDWGGGVYVNYVFVAVWAAETMWWGVSPASYARQPTGLRWTLRVFYLVVIVNAAIVFAVGWRRWLGAGIVATLLWSWKSGFRLRT